MKTVDSIININLTGLSALAAAMLSLCIGLLILSRDPKSRRSQSFFLITLTGSVWIFLFSIFNFDSVPTHSTLYVKLWFLLSVPFISPSVYLFTCHWTGNKRNKWLIRTGYLLAVLYGIFFFLFADRFLGLKTYRYWRINYFPPTPLGSIFYFSILLLLFSYAFLAFLKIVKAIKNATSPQNKIQFQYFLWGGLIGYTGVVDFIAARGVAIYPFGYISFTLFVLIISYAIVRHQFLEINVVLKKITLIFLIYSVLFAFLLPILFPLVSHLFVESSKQAWQMVALSLGVGTVLSFGPIIYAYLVHRSFWLRGNISTGLTHELKSPLSSIQSALDIAMAQIKNPNTDKEQTLQYLNMIQSNADRLDQFVKNLLHVAKNEEGALQLTQSTINIYELVKKTIDAAVPQLEQKNLKYRLEIPHDLRMDADETKIEQVFSNLISNAIKYCDQGTLFIFSEDKGSYIQFSIRDEGRGISKKDLEKVFDRFYQVTQNTNGAGIGLTIAKAWVEAHGGKIWAESEGEGKGTTMRFTIPV